MSLVVAGATGGLYLEDKATVDEGCPQLGGQRVCATSEAFDAAERGRTLGLINTITLPVGIVALGVGAALFFVAADGTTEVSFAPTLGPQHGGAVLRGRF